MLGATEAQGAEDIRGTGARINSGMSCLLCHLYQVPGHRSMVLGTQHKHERWNLCPIIRFAHVRDQGWILSTGFLGSKGWCAQGTRTPNEVEIGGGLDLGVSMTTFLLGYQTALSPSRSLTVPHGCRRDCERHVVVWTRDTAWPNRRCRRE